MIFLALSLALGFLTTFVGTPYARKYLISSGIYGVDQQKEGKPKLATSGGISVVFGFIISITAYLGFSSFLNPTGVNFNLILAALSSVCIITIIGLVDDIHINLEKYVQEELEIEDFELDIGTGGNERLPLDRISEVVALKFSEARESGEVHREGLRQNLKMLFVLPAAFPLIAVGAGSWTMSVPVIGTKIHWGIIYPLILLPIGLLFVSNVVNMLAGTNGLAAGMSLVASTALGIFALINQQIEAALISFGLAASLLGFLRYNFYPASILPGDSLTYLCGAAIFSAIVLGNMEKFAVFIFAPWMLEFFLKLRSGFQAHSWGVLQEDRTLKSKHDKIYSLTHILMKRGLTEKQITASLIGLESLICVAGLILFILVL